MDCAMALSGPRYALYGLPVFEIRWSHVQPGGSSVLPSTLGGNLAGFAGATSSSLESATTEGVVDGDMSKSSSLSTCAFAAAASDAGAEDGAEGGKGGGGLVPPLQGPMPSISRTSCLRVRVSGHRRFWSGEEAPSSTAPRAPAAAAVPAAEPAAPPAAARAVGRDVEEEAPPDPTKSGCPAEAVTAEGLPATFPAATAAPAAAASAAEARIGGRACGRFRAVAPVDGVGVPAGRGPMTRAAPGTRLHSSVDRSPFCTKLALQVHVSRAGGVRLGPGSSFVLQPPSQMRPSGAL
mmetsp:Transcript_101132/g.284080  ORF Transcript_101132/g.284080 Transcript_101132/m.284080 type:complete len:294 (+) Transcript_101132:565-1446(+)